MVNSPRPWRAGEFDVFDANGNMVIINHPINISDVVEAVNFYDMVCRSRERGNFSLPGCCSHGHPCSIDDAHDAIYLLNRIEEIIEGSGMARWNIIRSREDLQAIFFHVSRIRSKILDKWQENGYSEEAMRVKEEERRMLDEERIEYV